MGKNFNTPPWESSAHLNRLAYSNWFNRIYNIAITRFKWNDMPEFCKERFVEQVLFWEGMAVGFKDNELGGEIILPAMQSGYFDVFGNPKITRAYSYNGEYTNTDLNQDNSVLLYNNYARTPDLPIIISFAKRLAAIDRTIDLNLKAQKAPRVALANENEKFSVKNMQKQIDNFEPWVYVNKESDLRNNFQVLDLTSPYICDSLQSLKRGVLNECLTFLGIEANAGEKAERQLAGEIELTLGQTEAYRYSPLCAREEFCEKFNEMFGTNISVEMRSTLQLSRAMDENFVTPLEVGPGNANNPNNYAPSHPLSGLEGGTM